MPGKSSGHQPIHFLPEFVCEAIPAPGLSMTRGTGSEPNGPAAPSSPDEGNKPDETRPDAAMKPESEEPKGAV
jgi:hypothetical protein